MPRNETELQTRARWEQSMDERDATIRQLDHNANIYWEAEYNGLIIRFKDTRTVEEREAGTYSYDFLQPVRIEMANFPIITNGTNNYLAFNEIVISATKADPKKRQLQQRIADAQSTLKDAQAELDAAQTELAAL